MKLSIPLALLPSLLSLSNILSQSTNRVINCAYIGNSTESVELICGSLTEMSIDFNGTIIKLNETLPFPAEIDSSDDDQIANNDCYTSLFQSDFSEINRSLVKILKITGCTPIMNETFLEDFKNVTNLDISNLGIMSPYRHSTDLNLDFFDYLEKLNASHNEIIAIPTDLFEFMENLIEIDFSHNKIISIFSDTFNGADALVSLDLSHNELAHLESSALFDLDKLLIVDLSNNLLETFDMAIFTYNDLLLLRLDNNRIKRLVYASGYIPTFTTLIAFNAEGNQIENISDIFIQCLGPALRILNLAGNPIKRLNVTTFKGLSDLKYLKLNHTQLSHFEFGTFEQLENLTHLDLAYNQLNTLNFTPEKFKNLEMLNLEGNDLTEMDRVSPINFPKLNKFGVSRNRLSCDYAKKLVEQWEMLEIIGDPCDQIEIDVFSREQILILFIAIGLTFTTITLIYVYWQKRSYKFKGAENKYDEPVVLEIPRQDSVEIRHPVFKVNDQPGNGPPANDQPQHVEPIYAEIGEGAANRVQYDKLQFVPLPNRMLSSAYDRLFRR